MNIAHPWHGIASGNSVPNTVNAYIEITPFDTVKYELDKESGLLKIDRPQQFSNTCPALYGFIPRTYCGEATRRLSAERSGLEVTEGDGDPLDICVLSEKHITHGNILLQCVPLGGFRMIDKAQADDKIIAVMKDDLVYGKYTDISQIPEAVTKRLFHYFLTYKLNLQDHTNYVQITHTYNRDEAHEVIFAAIEDYKAKF